MLISQNPAEWLSLKNVPIVDVRAPSEFARGHVPNAHLIPLFSDETRADVGTCYKQLGKDAAIQRGITLVAPQINNLIEECLVYAPDRIVRIYCARGGMRSRSFATMLSMLGYTVYILIGGYKAYRNYVLNLFKRSYKIVVLAGKTGSGKTDILGHLAQHGEQFIDLEKLASHKGSVFGGLGELEQPTQQLFENRLADTLECFDITKRIWFEDESIKIGALSIPYALFMQMRSAPVIYLNRSISSRIAHLQSLYGNFDPIAVSNCVLRLEKYLGNERTKELTAYIQTGDAIGFALLLEYYDDMYEKGLTRTTRTINYINAESLCFEALAKELSQLPILKE